MKNSWGSFISAISKPPWITSQWNYVLYLRFGLPFKMATSRSDFAKSSDLFGINKFKEFQVDVLNKILEILLTPVKWHRGGKCYFSAWDWNPRPLVHKSAALQASRATCHRPCPSRTSIYFLSLVRKSLYAVIEIEKYFIVTCDFIGRRLVSPASCIFMKTRFC